LLIGAGAFVTAFSPISAVIKVESRSHPTIRSPVRTAGAKPLESPGYFASRNTSKKSTLNMSLLQARQIMLRLAGQCSIVSNNFVRAMEKWGLGYTEVAAVNPSVIYLAMPMQGSAGPHRAISASARPLPLCGSPTWRGCRRAPTHRYPLPHHAPNPGHALVAVWRRSSIARARERHIEPAQIESTVNVLGPSILAWSATGALPQIDGNRRGARCRAASSCWRGYLVRDRGER
jgi:benzylsuccinate CoA-transferase BbsF subunit